MMKCTELAKKGNRSLVEIVNTDTERIEKYVVCSNFDNAKAYGNKWDWGTYFDVNSGDNPEEKLEKAIRNLYDMDDKREISYDRMTDLAIAFVRQLRDYVDDDEEFARVLKGEDITEVEAEFFDVKDIVFPKLYKVVNVTLKREQFVTVKVVMPDDEDCWSADEYIENKEYIEDAEDIKSEDWEFDDYGIEEGEMTKEYFKQNYNSDTVWNADDIDEI